MINFDLGDNHLAQPVASLISNLPSCSLLNALYSVSVLRHHVCDAMQIVRGYSQALTNEQRQARYLAACEQVLSKTKPFEKNFKQIVGEVIHNALVGIVGLRAGKITGMLIAMPNDDLLKMMRDWSLLLSNTQFANDSLNREHQDLLPSARFLRACWKILPAVRRVNPNYKKHVGELFHPYVSQLVDHGINVNLVTSMLIDCPINDIKHMMRDFFHFKLRIMQASDVLTMDVQKLDVSDCESTTESVLTADTQVSATQEHY